MTRAGVTAWTVRGRMRLLTDGCRQVFPGVAVAALVTMSATLVAEHHGGPVMLLALLMGMAINFLGDDPRTGPGLQFCGRQILRMGVALLGARITFEHFADVGWQPLVLLVIMVLLVIAAGALLAPLLGYDRWFGVLSGGAVAICGASAAVALAAVVPQGKDHATRTAFTVIGVTTLSTVAMVLYPILAPVVALDARATGFFLGATIHDVAQVIGAGYSVSEDTGDTAAVVKLFRVSLLLPIVLLVSLLVRWRTGRRGQASGEFPLFLAGFALLVVLGSLDILAGPVRTVLSDTSRWALVLAIAAIGVTTPISRMRTLGPAAIVLILVETLFIAILGIVVAGTLQAPAPD